MTPASCGEPITHGQQAGEKVVVAVRAVQVRHYRTLKRRFHRFHARAAASLLAALKANATPRVERDLESERLAGAALHRLAV